MQPLVHPLVHSLMRPLMHLLVHSKVAGTLSKGVAALSMDDDYLASRVQSRTTKQKASGDNLGQGMLRGASGLGLGVAKGMSSHCRYCRRSAAPTLSL